MAKIILWLVVIFAVLFVLRMINVAKSARAQRASRPEPETKAVMVKCVECGIYLPQAESRAGPRGPVCGDEGCRERVRQAR